MSKKRGRRSLMLNEEKVSKFLEYIEAGNDFDISADASGIARSTLYNWLSIARGVEDKMKSGFSPNPLEHKFLDFLEKYKRARVAIEIKSVAAIAESVEKGSWRAAAWFLERRYPERWSDKKINDSIPDHINTEQFSSKQLELKVLSALEILQRQDRSELSWPNN